MSDSVESRSFDMFVRHARPIIETILNTHFGQRCPDYCEDCEVCRRWKLMDDLLESPYLDSDEATDER